MKKKLNMIVAAGIALSSMGSDQVVRAHCGGCGAGAAKQDIVDTAVAAGGFKTLVAAVQAAGLVETLKSDGPFTVFAPTDEAFSRLPKGTLETLLANPDQLGAILKYHVVPGKVLAADVVKLSSAKTALGQSVSINASTGVMIDGATVVKADIKTSNGVIHVIDSVLIPDNDIVETARAAGSFKTLLAALEAANLTGALQGDGPFTVFAPTDEAFAKLPKGTVEALLQDIPKLTSILTYHVVAGKVTASDVVKLDSAETLQGQSVQVDATSGVKINSAQVVKADIMTDNGVIHVIDQVLLPPSAKQSNAKPQARKLIGQAIERGVSLFNEGQHEACMAVYEIAAMGLLSMNSATLTDHDRGNLKRALDTVQASHDSTKNAWTLRHALDSVYASTMVTSY